jgi:DNA-binding NarL/FixJ family response regulator
VIREDNLPALSARQETASSSEGSEGEPKSDSFRIFLVDDHDIVREGITHLLNRETDLKICGGAQDAESALAAIKELQPDLVISDISLGSRDGIELVREIRARYPDVLVLMLSMFDDLTYAERAIRAGAAGYVMKRRGSEELLSAIRTVLRGEIYVSSKVASSLLRRLSGARPAKESNPVDELSDRELQILRCIGQGLSVREIAKQLYLSAKTVESHRENMKRKLKLKSSGELLQYAIEHSRVSG